MRSLLILALLTTHCLAQADTLTGRVVRVTDSDTIVILDSANTRHKIRLQGTDAPERRQAFGTKSKEHLSDSVAGKLVVVEYSMRDRYERILGKVLLSGKDMNLEQIRADWHGTTRSTRNSRHHQIVSYTQSQRLRPERPKEDCGMLLHQCHHGNTKEENKMTKIPNIADIIASYSNQDKTLQESAADLGAIILEMEREEQNYGVHTKRMAKLKRLAMLQERVVERMLDRSIEDKPKRPRLTVVK